MEARFFVPATRGNTGRLLIGRGRMACRRWSVRSVVRLRLRLKSGRTWPAASRPRGRQGVPFETIRYSVDLYPSTHRDEPSRTAWLDLTPSTTTAEACQTDRAPAAYGEGRDSRGTFDHVSAVCRPPHARVSRAAPILPERQTQKGRRCLRTPAHFVDRTGSIRIAGWSATRPDGPTGCCRRRRSCRAAGSRPRAAAMPRYCWRTKRRSTGR